MTQPTIFKNVVAVDDLIVHTTAVGGSCIKCSKHAKVTGVYVKDDGWRLPFQLCMDHAQENQVI